MTEMHDSIKQVSTLCVDVSAPAPLVRLLCLPAAEDSASALR